MEHGAARIVDFPIPNAMRKSPAVPEQLVPDAGDEHETEPPEMLQQRLQVVASQREQMQQMEIQLRAQIIARTEIADVKKCFNAKVQELMKEQIPEKEDSRIRVLQMTVEEKGRELIAVKRDNELKQRQILELQEQYQVARETITSKDEQLRRAHEWLDRIRTTDASCLATVQAELLGDMAHFQVVNTIQSPSLQQSELQEQIMRQQAMPEISFHDDCERGKTPMLDRCHVNPASENEAQQDDGPDGNHFTDLSDDGNNNLGGNLTYRDLTKADIVGMTFGSFEAAESFYRRYAIALGFGIRKQDMRRRVSGVVNMYKWVCNRQGRRREKYLERENRQRRPRPITRVGCPALFQVNMESIGKWIVRQAVLEHNHELTSPLDACFLSEKTTANAKREKRPKTSGDSDVND